MSTQPTKPSTPHPFDVARASAALQAHLRSLPDAAAREAFAVACGTTINYLRKVLSRKRFVPDAALCVAIERESGGAVRCEVLRPDVDWTYLRCTECPIPAMDKAA